MVRSSAWRHAGVALALLGGSLLGLSHVRATVAQSTDLAVSTFQEDSPAIPGSTVQRTLRVNNRAPEELMVHVVHRGVQLLDDGQTRILPDDTTQWAGRMVIDPSDFTLPGMGARDVTLRIAVPADAPPDDSLLAVGVSSVPPGGGGIRAALEIGTLVSLTVPGDRVRSIEVVQHDLPGLVIGDRVAGRVRVRNTGTGLVAVWLDASVVNGWTGGRVADLSTRDKSQIAPAAARDLDYVWPAGITAGLFRVPVHVLYNQRDATSAQVSLDESVWLIHPILIVGLIACLLAGGLLVVRWRRLWRQS